MPSTGSRVAWALGETMARGVPRMAFMREDLPALGRPARATVPKRVGGMRKDAGRRERGEGRRDHPSVSRFSIKGKKEAGPRMEDRLPLGWLTTVYSPTTSRWQYHRRCRA